MFLDTKHKLLAHKDKPLVQEKWRLFKTKKWLQPVLGVQNFYNS